MSTHRSPTNLLERDETKTLPAMDDEPILNTTSNNFARLDLRSIRQSVYDLIDQYPGQVLFLEYLTRHNRVENMTASSYKNLYQFYKKEYSEPQSFVKIIEHKGTQYDLKIQTFQSKKEEFIGPEILAMAFGYAISGMNLITVSRRK